MRTAIVMLGALLAPRAALAEVVVVPDAPPGAPARLIDEVVPALRASAPPGWRVRPIGHHAAPPDAAADADAALWAEIDGDALVLHLYRRATDRVVTLPLGLDARGAAPAAAVREAVRLQVEYLFQSRGGTPWATRRPPPAPPPLPPPPPPLPAARAADLTLAPPRLPPAREPAVLPVVPPPVIRTVDGGTEVEVARRGEAPDDGHAGALAGVPGAPAAPPSTTPTRLGLGVGLRADAVDARASVGLDVGLRVGGPWLDLELTLLPPAGDDAAALRTALGLTLPLWRGPIDGALAVHLAYEGLPAVGGGDAHRGAGDLGLRLAARLSPGGALALRVGAIASPWTLRDAGGAVSRARIGLAAGITWVVHFAEAPETARPTEGSEGRTGNGGATAWQPGSW